MAGVINNRNDTYQHRNSQENKNDSIASSKILVKTIREKILQLKDVATCEEYEPNDDNLRIKGAPAVRLPNGKLVIAPDLKCTSKSGKVFWVEVKDKCQRFYKPDTGADLHQILGFYQINNELDEPVLMIFQDAALNACFAKTADDTAKQRFTTRWNLFGGQPYGNWFCNCIQQNSKFHYPLLALEKSRDNEMYIFYFSVYNLQPINFEQIFSTIPSASNNIKISAFSQTQEKYLNEEELSLLSY
jgi:hypothetical protein